VKQLLIEACLAKSARSHIEIERFLWPAKIVAGALQSFIVPIRPDWAMHLFDYNMASKTLFGADPRLALNVYYRASRPYILSAPSRILWYVSQDRKYTESMHIRACSYATEVVAAPPKEMFHRFKRLGIYGWDDIKRIVKGNLEKPVMGFTFSHSELFTRPISWKMLQETLHVKDGKQSQIQSPVRISEECFMELYRIGMGLKC